MTSILKRNRIKDTVSFILGILLLGFLIQFAGSLKGDRLVFPGVPEILKAFFRMLGRPETYRLILTSMKHLIQSLAVASVIGIFVGILEGYSDLVRSLLKPFMIFLRSIPMIVMVVIIMVLTKYTRVPIIATTLFLIPLISEAVCEGYRNLDPNLIDVYRLNGSFSMYVMTHVHLPLMAGYLKQAYISSVGMGLKLVVSTEYLVQTRNSLGKAVYSSSYFNEYEEIYAYALIMIALVLIVSWIPALITKVFRRKA
ncbi:MAG: ABC transporter permease subunit [Lachnospiraceae bacterium]|nr:ABC transporter permease subunit [Lachnospiraceae bacterium]